MDDLHLRLTHPPSETDDYVWIKRCLGAHVAGVFSAEDSPHEVATLTDPAGAAIGGIISYTRLGWKHIDSLWVDPGHRRGGLGARLLDHVERQTADEALFGVRIVTTTSHDALGLYQRRGYQTDARWPLRGGEPDLEEVHLSKRLQAGETPNVR